jgi:hypothetical protein
MLNFCLNKKDLSISEEEFIRDPDRFVIRKSHDVSSLNFIVIPYLAKAFKAGNVSRLELILFKSLNVKRLIYFQFVLLFSPYGTSDFAPILLISLFTIKLNKFVRYTFGGTFTFISFIALLMVRFIPFKNIKAASSIVRFNALLVRSIAFQLIFQLILLIDYELDVSYAMSETAALMVLVIFFGLCNCFLLILSVNFLCHRLWLCFCCNWIVDSVSSITNTFVNTLDIISTIRKLMLRHSNGENFLDLMIKNSKQSNDFLIF